jgi:DNA polymerase III delta subunit
MSPNIQLIYGDDDYLVDLHARQELRGEDTETIDGNVTNRAELQKCLLSFQTAVRTPSFFSTHSRVWLRNVRFLEPSGPAFNEGGQELLDGWTACLASLPNDVQVVVSACPVDKRSRIFKWLESHVHSVLVQRTEEAVMRLIGETVRARAVTIHAEAQDLLLQKLGSCPRAVVHEIEKLCTCVGEGNVIDAPLVHALSPSVAGEDFFEPVEAFYSNDVDWAMRSLRDFALYQKEFRPLLAALHNRNRLLIQLQILGDDRSRGEMTRAAERYKETFGGDYSTKHSLCVFSQNPWFLGKLKKHHPLSKLLFIHNLLLETFEKILVPSGTQLRVLETMVLRAFSWA